MTGFQGAVYVRNKSVCPWVGGDTALEQLLKAGGGHTPAAETEHT